MSNGWKHISLTDVERNPDKPGKRWELSSDLAVDAFNFNVAILDPDEHLSQNHFHYHENQQEMFYLVEGTCRVETPDEGFEMGPDEAVVFEKGEVGAHVIHNPFDEPCKLVAIGWPPEGRHPVHQTKATNEFTRRDRNDPQ